MGDSDKKNLYKNKTLFQKIWYFLWTDESLISWMVLFVFSFLVIFFVFFPLSEKLFSSKLPYVVIESGSMVHEGNFDAFWDENGLWYDERNITKEEFENFNFKNGLGIGDIIVLRGKENYSLGDVIVFAVPDEKPVIHRVVDIKNRCVDVKPERQDISKVEYEECYVIRTKGDANTGQLKVEINITRERIFGKAIFRISKLGYVKLIPCSILSPLCNFIDSLGR